MHIHIEKQWHWRQLCDMLYKGYGGGGGRHLIANMRDQCVICPTKSFVILGVSPAPLIRFM